MDESILNSTEAEVESQTEGIENEDADADDDGWDSITWGSDEGEDAREEDGGLNPESENPEADQQTEDANQETTDADKPDDNSRQKSGEEDQFLELKYMDETRKVSREEAKTLAQKGLDYDRIRGERDEMQKDYQTLKGYKAFLEEMKGNFPSVEALITDTRARMLAEKESISYADAVAKVNLQSQTQPQREDQPRGNDAVQRFVEEYPGVKAEEIPQSVWDEVKKTGDLVAAYNKYDRQKQAERISQLEAEIETLRQNRKNVERSPGSSKTAGNTSAKSLIQTLWEEDDD